MTHRLWLINQVCNHDCSEIIRSPPETAQKQKPVQKREVLAECRMNQGWFEEVFFKLQSNSFHWQYEIVRERNRTVVFSCILTNQKKQRDSKPNSNLSSSRTPAKNRSSNWSPASSTALLAPLQPPNQVNRSKPIFSTTRKLNNPNADLDSGEGNTHFPHGGAS